jgi:SpoVK/Ycf46/Vps4 family AAA+-type ATPase
MGKQRMLAMVQMLRTDENIGDALLVALGTLFLLLPFPFYPLYISFALAALSGAIAYKLPPAGTIAGMFFALPAIAYQAPVLAWVFSLAIAVTLFEAFGHWSVISFLEIAILAPFAPFPFSLVSGFLFLLLAVAALRFGSRRSFTVSLPAIFIVLLLSAIWLQPTASFITISKDYESLYGPAMGELQNNALAPVELADIAPASAGAVASLFDFDRAIAPVSPALEKIADSAIKLLASDFALVQLVVWAAALYACAMLPAQFGHRYKQAIAASALFLVPVSNFLLAPAFKNPAEPMGFIYCALSVGAIAAMEHYGISLSREKMVERGQKQKAFGKFGDGSLPDSGVDTLEQVGGYEDVKAELREAIVTPLKKPEFAYAYNIRPPKGVLLFGPPGTGKTMLMRALANELDIGFRYVKCSELLSEWYGESEKNLSEVFSIARKSAPFLLFFDEIDSIGKKRDSYTSDDVAPRVMSVLLQELDGFAPNPKKPVIFVGATNLPDQLDPALMRPGRFDKIIYMHLPDKEARAAIFKVNLRKLPSSDDIDFARLAAITERYSGADIKNIVTEASRLAAREAMTAKAVVKITMAHLTSVLKRIKPSNSLDSLENYERFRMDFERRSDAEEKKPDEKGVRWDDVAGLEEVRRILLEAIEIPLLHEELMKEMDVQPSKGLLLYGPPGCGKTMIVKAAANELNANFLTISGSELMKSRDKAPSAYVKEVFNRARESAPALVFVDEIEALAPNREEYRGGILTELLQELDGVKELKNVMIVGATNKPFALDAAILRPGRFDKILYIPPPDAPARKQVFSLGLAKFLKKVSLDRLAEATEGYSGADIASICQEVKMGMVRERLKGKPTEATTDSVLAVAATRRPSITAKDLREYESFTREYGERR